MYIHTYIAQLEFSLMKVYVCMYICTYIPEVDDAAMAEVAGGDVADRGVGEIGAVAGRCRCCCAGPHTVRPCADHRM